MFNEENSSFKEIAISLKTKKVSEDQKIEFQEIELHEIEIIAKSISRSKLTFFKIDQEIEMALGGHYFRLFSLT